MFHAPGSETKQQNDSTRTQSPRSDFSASVPVAPGSVPMRSQLARLHSTYGNQAVLRMLSQSAPTIQTKLTVNKPGDEFEQEADRVADQVMRMTAPPPQHAQHLNPRVLGTPAPASSVQRKCSGCEEEEKLQRKCAGCEEEENKAGLQRKETGAGPEFAPLSVQSVLNSPGRPLDPATRAFMEPRFGHDFSAVRVHTGPEAAESAQSASALAYTVGRNMVFGNGQYAPESTAGRKLLAHELAHTIQQSADSATAPMIKHRGSLRVARYGHTSECNEKDHLKPFIWPGHSGATDAVSNAMRLLGESPINPQVERELKSKFGVDASLDTNKSKIVANFEKIQTALKGDYRYHCANPCEKPNQGVRAWTDKSSKDVTICFDQVSGYSPEAAAWVIMHENVHRGMDVWAHAWWPGDFGSCLSGGGWTPPALVLDNPDSYACFASITSKIKPK